MELPKANYPVYIISLLRLLLINTSTRLLLSFDGVPNGPLKALRLLKADTAAYLALDPISIASL